MKMPCHAEFLRPTVSSNPILLVRPREQAEVNIAVVFGRVEDTVCKQLCVWCARFTPVPAPMLLPGK